MKMKRSNSLAAGVCACLAFVAAPLVADEVSAERPVLGYVVDAKSAGLRAVLGVPESPRFGDLESLPEGVSILAIAPGHDWALAVRESADAVETGAMVIATRAFTRIAPGRAEHFVFSPSGRDVAISSADETAVVFSGLPGDPKESLRGDAPDVVAVAVSDGAKFAVLRANGRFETLSQFGRALLGEVDQFQAMAFGPASDGLILYSRATSTVSRIDDPMAPGAARVLANGVEGMDFLAVGRAEILLAKRGGGVYTLNLSGEQLRNVDTPAIQRLDAMRLPSLRLLSAEAGEPAWLLSPAGVSGVPAVREVVE